jgi:hypothetical protein
MDLRNVLKGMQVFVVIFGRLAVSAPHDGAALPRLRVGHILVRVRAVLLVLQTLLIINFVELRLLIFSLPARA